MEYEVKPSGIRMRLVDSAEHLARRNRDIRDSTKPSAISNASRDRRADHR